MKIIFLFTLIIISSITHSQNIPKGTNKITVKNISFKQIVKGLRDNGYTIKKLDTNLKIVRTGFLVCHSRSGLLSLSISVRLKDSIAIITGLWYSYTGLSDGLLTTNHAPRPGDIFQVRYSLGDYKETFLQMNKFAQSLKEQIIYSESQ
jgi:hypothetical protein